MAAELKKIDCQIASKNAVDLLSELLESARSGKLLSVAAVWNDRDDYAHTVFANDSSRSGLRDLVAGTVLLQARLADEYRR